LIAHFKRYQEKKILHQVKVILWSISIATYVNAASFNCDKASSDIEKTICGNWSISQDDEKLSKYFSVVKKSLQDNDLKAFINDQKQWLKKRNTECRLTEEDARAECLQAHYKDRIREFKRKYNAVLFRFPSEQKLHEICTDISLNPSLYTELNQIIEEKFDVNNDGVEENVSCTSQGTAHVPYCQYKLPEGKNIEIGTIGFEWKNYWTYGLKYLGVEGKTYKLNFLDDQHEKPAYLSYITPVNEEYVVCEFENKQIETMIPNPQIDESKDICLAVQNNDLSKISYLSFTEQVESGISKQERFQQSWSTPMKQGKLDFDNDGTLNSLVEINYASGAGRGCDFHYYDEITLDSTGFTTSESRDLLLKMQSIDLDAFHPNCGSFMIVDGQGMHGTRYFKYKDLNYYEYRTKTDHKVFLIADHTIKTVCISREKATTSLKTVKPENMMLKAMDDGSVLENLY
jgi:uncharacterized protein